MYPMQPTRIKIKLLMKEAQEHPSDATSDSHKERPVGATRLELGCSYTGEIPGLTIRADFADHEMQKRLMAEINSISGWQTSLARRVIQYGFRYVYKSEAGDRRGALMSEAPFPPWIQSLADQLQTIVDRPLRQCIINEYHPGQCITAHSDSPKFGNTVVTLSLGVAAKFIYRWHKTICREFRLLPGTLLIMRDEARYFWTHEMCPDRSQRGNRYSITF